MTILTPSSKLTEDQRSLFQTGMSFLMQEHELSIGVWDQHTPEHEGSACIAIGACELRGPSAVPFLKECISHLKKTYPNRAIIGPMNGNTWMKHRLILESSERTPFLMEPIEPIELTDIFKDAGFEVLSRYSSSAINLCEPQPCYQKLDRLLAKQGVTIRSITSESFENDIRQIYHLSLTAFSNNFLYTPLPEQAFMRSYESAKDSIDPDFVLLAHQGDELIGFLFCHPDQEPHTLIVKTLATHPEHRTAGLGTRLVAMAQERAKEKGYTTAIHALQFESNASLRISKRFNAEKFRTYGLMIVK